MKEEFKVISKLIDERSRVLDVGCGDGILMEYLSKNKVVDVRGLEISKEKVKKCLSNGLAVVEGNAEYDLKQFPDLSFDYVILSQTLQAFMSPENVIKDLLRVGKKVIVTIPNFGHWKIRVDLLFKGEMPITKNLPYEWYNTPNLHMCTIQDFYNFCNNKGINIFKTISLNGQKTSKITASNLKYKNLISELGIFLLEK
ncbi:methionine biosynthesis protein MetW [Pelagibacterales bacterium SAG-MED16]|jgi:methionine biosynthesis protein MetW|nr:methionine biosynthesis protein MetW [Pelagibacterales bacterium SAG-MED16]